MCATCQLQPWGQRSRRQQEASPHSLLPADQLCGQHHQVCTGSLITSALSQGDPHTYFFNSLAFVDIWRAARVQPWRGKVILTPWSLHLPHPLPQKTTSLLEQPTQLRPAQMVFTCSSGRVGRLLLQSEVYIYLVIACLPVVLDSGVSVAPTAAAVVGAPLTDITLSTKAMSVVSVTSQCSYSSTIVHVPQPESGIYSLINC